MAQMQHAAAMSNAMLTRFVISVSLTAGICVPFYLPYATSRSLSRERGCVSTRARKYPAIGPFFHLY
ncbi:hypothetical protein BDV12DRAFT_177991 [Aspergillus spectabilis]